MFRLGLDEAMGSVSGVRTDPCGTPIRFTNGAFLKRTYTEHPRMHRLAAPVSDAAHVS